MARSHPKCDPDLQPDDDENEGEAQPQDPERHKGWLTGAEVGKILGKTVQAVRAMRDTGEIIGELVERGGAGGRKAWLYPPEQFVEGDDSAGAEKAEKDLLLGASTLVRQTKELIASASSFALQVMRDCHRILTESGEKTNQLLSDAFAGQQKQILELQDRNYKMREQFEEALSKSHERAMVEKQLDLDAQSSERKWREVAPFMRMVVEGWLRDRGLIEGKATAVDSKEGEPVKDKPEQSKPESEIDNNPWRGLVQSLTSEQGETLIKTGAFSYNWLFETMAPLIMQYKTANTEANLMLLATKVEKIVVGLKPKQREALVSVLTPIQSEYLKIIEQSAKEP